MKAGALMHCTPCTHLGPDLHMDITVPRQIAIFSAKDLYSILVGKLSSLCQVRR